MWIGLVAADRLDGDGIEFQAVPRKVCRSPEEHDVAVAPSVIVHRADEIAVQIVSSASGRCSRLLWCYTR